MSRNVNNAKCQKCKMSNVKCQTCKMSNVKNIKKKYLIGVTPGSWRICDAFVGHCFDFPRLGLPIRGSNCILKQPVGCTGVSAPRVPWGTGPPLVPWASRAWFLSPKVKSQKCQKNPKCQKHQFFFCAAREVKCQTCKMSNMSNMSKMSKVKCQMSNMSNTKCHKCQKCQTCQKC